MLKKVIYKIINENRNEIFEFIPLNEYLDNLQLLNYNVIPFNNENIKGYKRLDIKNPTSSICFEFIKSTPTLELVHIKKYNCENIMQEETCFIHKIIEEDIEYNNCIINFISSEIGNNVEIIKKEYYYNNNDFLNKTEEKIAISKEDFQNIFDKQIKSLNPTTKELHYKNGNIELTELEKKYVTLSGIYLLAKNYQDHEKKKIKK